MDGGHTADGFVGGRLGEALGSGRHFGWLGGVSDEYLNYVGAQGFLS